MDLAVLTHFATEEAATGGILGTLGIDVKLLVFQLIAFVLLIVILNKWIFPVFFKIIDKRQAVIEESNRAAVEASKQAEKSQAEIEKMLKQARVEAKDIVATAKDEATEMMRQAEEKSKAEAQHIVAVAHESLAKDVLAAKKALHNETVELVALATEKVVGKTVTKSVDTTLIKDALKEVQ